jgi:hypothetical protein
MKSDKRSKRSEARPLCADVHADDGPQHRHRKPHRPHGDANGRSTEMFDRKTLQLCAQVRRALYGAIPLGASQHLLDAVIEAVQPAPDASRLRIVVSIPASQFDRVSSVKRMLDGVTPHVRAEVAAQICRKRTPVLAFTVLVREEEP